MQLKVVGGPAVGGDAGAQVEHALDGLGGGGVLAELGQGVGEDGVRGGGIGAQALGVAASSGTYALLSPANSPPVVDAGVYYHVAPDLSIVQVNAKDSQQKSIPLVTSEATLQVQP